jgi:putative membrane protein
MIWIANILVALVAALHVYFLVLEMFLWTKPLGLKTFRNSIEKATDSAVLAANQGLCVIVAGVYGAATVSRRILWVQAAPAAVALILLWLA